MTTKELRKKAEDEICGPNGLDLGPVRYICNDQEVEALGFRKGPNTIREMLNQSFSEHSKKEFLVFNERRYSFSDARNAVMRICALLKDLGLKTHDRVAVASRNSDFWCLVYMATTFFGATCVPINSHWKTEELSYALQDSGATLIFCDDERLERLDPVIKDSSKLQIVLFDHDIKNVEVSKSILSFSRLFENAREINERELPKDVDQNAIACIMYTSGTTGFPKGVCQTHGNVTQALRVILMQSMVGQAVRQVRNTRPSANYQACVICPVPLFHVTALYPILMVSVAIGRKVVMMPKWSTKRALELIEKEKPTMWVGVPTMIQDIMEHPDFSKTDTSSIKSMFGGGAATPSGQVKKMKSKFGKKSSPGNGYGLTETITSICSVSGDDYVKRPTTSGKALPICEIRVINLELAEQGRFLEVKQGESGEIVVKSPMVMSGYYNKKEKTDEAIVEVEGRSYGWFRTGDIGKIDDEGYVYILDRAKDIIIRGGENISCAEVESALMHHPDVLECAVYGVKDERLGEIVGASVVLKETSDSFIKLKEGCSSADELDMKKSIIDYAATHLAKFKVPEMKHFEILLEPLPRGATGKILKRVIREAANEKLKSRL